MGATTDNPAEVFKAMAARIERNHAAEFGGAFVVVSPKGEIVSYAAFDPMPDPSAFWAMADASMKTALAEFMQKENARSRLQR